MTSIDLGSLVAQIASIILIKGSVLILVGMGAAAVFRSANAATRSVCWTALAIALAGLPVLSAIMPRVVVPVPLEQHLTDAGFGLASAPAVPNGPSDEAPANASLSRSHMSWQRVIVVALFLSWAIGATLLITGLTVAFARLRAIRRRATPVDIANLPGDLAPLRRKIGRSVLILASSHVQVPVAGGLVRPFIILPTDWRTWDSSRLRAVMVHELAHVARRDFSAHLLFEIVRAFYWPNPLVWLAMARATTDRELAADDRVLADGTNPADYATELLAFAAVARPITQRAAMSIAPSALKRRIRSILDSGVDRGVPTRRRVGVIMSIASVGMSSVATLSAAPSHSNRELAHAWVVPSAAETDVAHRREHVMLVPTLGDAQNDSLLKALLFDGDIMTRRGAARGLRSAGARDAVSMALEAALQDSCYGDRYRAARALRELRDERVVPVLVQHLLADDHPAVRAMLANAIAAVGVAEGATLLRAALTGASGSSFDRVGRAIDTLGETPAHARLLGALREARQAH
jgi:beta-lactamase regulating signal transducer with metallopeptidase domain